MEISGLTRRRLNDVALQHRISAGSARTGAWFAAGYALFAVLGVLVEADALGESTIHDATGVWLVWWGLSATIAAVICASCVLMAVLHRNWSVFLDATSEVWGDAKPRTSGTDEEPLARP